MGTSNAKSRALPVVQFWPAALGWQGLKGKERPFLSQRSGAATHGSEGRHMACLPLSPFSCP